MLSRGWGGVVQIRSDSEGLWSYHVFRMPITSAAATASLRPRTPSFWIILLACFLTVSGEMRSLWAISLLVCRSARRARTSVSRLISGSTRFSIPLSSNCKSGKEVSICSTNSNATLRSASWRSRMLFWDLAL